MYFAIGVSTIICQGSLRERLHLSYIAIPPLLEKERGIKGVRLIFNFFKHVDKINKRMAPVIPGTG